MKITHFSGFGKPQRHIWVSAIENPENLKKYVIKITQPPSAAGGFITYFLGFSETVESV
jgi:hypothetical protein